MKIKILKKLFPGADKISVVEDTYVRPEKPTNCPVCNGRIECRDGSPEYVCIGLVSRTEIEKFHPHGLKLPQSVTEIKPCGWHGKLEEWGKTWE